MLSTSFYRKVISLMALMLFILLIGTFMYTTLEGWSLIDSLYFSAVTLSTIGYGDLHPTRPISKLFTVGYIFVGVGIMLYVLTALATRYFETQHIKVEKEVKRAITSLSLGKKKPDKWITLKIRDRNK